MATSAQARVSVGFTIASTMLWMTICVCGQLKHAFPPPGSIIVGDGSIESNRNLPRIYCEVLLDGDIQVTSWNLGYESRLKPITTNNDNFVITGEEISGLNSGTNLSIVALDASLDGRTLYCGHSANHTIVSFALRLYHPPNTLHQGETAYLVEGEIGNITIQETSTRAFPPAQQITWKRNDVVLTESNRQSLSYPSITFSPVYRSDTGFYSLQAINHKCDSNVLIPPDHECTSMEGVSIIGSGNGNIHLEVYYHPKITPGKRKFATKKGGSVTLICGFTPTGNPVPSISWRDSMGIRQPIEGSRFTLSLDRLRLTITSAELVDGGDWLCVLTGDSARGLLIHNESISVTIVASPGPPRDVLVIGVGATWAVIQWSPPNELGNPPYPLYQVTPDQLPGMIQSTNATSLNFTGLLPATDYRFAVRAVAKALEVEEKGAVQKTSTIRTNLTVPHVVCQAAPVSTNGIITVRWSYKHAGGLNLMAVTVQYGQYNSSHYQTIKLVDLSKTEVTVSLLPAGEIYLFRVTASNALGSHTDQCPYTEHLIGIPQQPATPRGLSRRVGEIVLALSTQEAGINKSLHSIMFLVNASRMTTSEAPELVKRTMTIEGYIDGIEVEFLVPGLVGGERYTFDVTVRNNFGESAVSESSLAVQVAREGENLTDSLIQLVLKGLQQPCSIWLMEQNEIKTQAVKLHLHLQIQDQCYCNFTTLHIARETLSCAVTAEDRVTFRTQLFGTRTVNSSVLLGYVRDWVNQDGTTLAVLNSTLSLDTACPLVIDSLGGPQCHQSNAALTSSIVIAIVFAVAIVFAMAVFVPLLITIVCIRRKQKRTVKLREVMYSKPKSTSQVEDCTLSRTSTGRIRYSKPAKAAGNKTQPTSREPAEEMLYESLDINKHGSDDEYVINDPPPKLPPARATKPDDTSLSEQLYLNSICSARMLPLPPVPSELDPYPLVPGLESISPKRSISLFELNLLPVVPGLEPVPPRRSSSLFPRDEPPGVVESTSPVRAPLQTRKIRSTTPVDELEYIDMCNEVDNGPLDYKAVDDEWYEPLDY